MNFDFGLKYIVLKGIQVSRLLGGPRFNLPFRRTFRTSTFAALWSTDTFRTSIEIFILPSVHTNLTFKSVTLILRHNTLTQVLLNKITLNILYHIKLYSFSENRQTFWNNISFN